MRKMFGALVLCLAGATAGAQETLLSGVTLHGFGEWAYTRSADENEYLEAIKEGDYDTLGFGLNVRSAINDQLTVTGQLGLRNGEEDQPDAKLDYAFAEWKFSDSMRFRLGRLKHPFGIYTEIYDIGTLRPFFHLPQGIYGPSEIASQAFAGGSLTGTVPTGAGAADWDLYIGEMTSEPGQSVGGDYAQEIRDVVGGRVTMHTRVDGLSLGASGYAGTTEIEFEDENGEEVEFLSRARTFGVHGEYLVLPFTLRAEAGWHREKDDATTRAFYVEGAYRFNEKLEAAARWDTLDVESLRPDLDDADHRDLALGLNYWFNPNFVVKLSVHQVKGFAVAEQDDESSTGTTAIVFGSQFSF
jgi:hypothetical protein